MNICKFVLASSAAVTMSVSGCASIQARNPPYPDAAHPCWPGVYPGVHKIVRIFPTAKPKLVPFLILDFPLSAIVDTVALPYDWPYWAAHKDSP